MAKSDLPTGSIAHEIAFALSPEAEVRIAAQRAGGGGDLQLPDLGDLAAVAQWRADQHEAWGIDGVAGEPEHVTTTIAGVECLIAGPSRAPTVMYLHGGGFCLGSPGTVRPITSRLAAKLRVVSVDYRLAPEHPFPAGLDDAVAVCAELNKDGPVGIAGDSAGGNLAVGVAYSDLRPAAIALFCPHLDFRTESAGMQLMSDAYLAKISPSDPLVSPIAASANELAQLPPILIQTTNTEALHPQALELADRIKTAGGSVELQVWPGLWHTWHYHRELPEAHAAVDRASDWLAAAVSAAAEE